MMVRIRYKLFISFILITLVTVMGVGLLLNFSFQDKFAEYVKSNLDEKHQNVINYIEGAIETDNSNHTIFMNVGHFSVMENVRVRIYQPDDKLIFDSIYSEKMMFPKRKLDKTISDDAYRTVETLNFDQDKLKIHVISELRDGFWSPNDMTFRQAINISLYGSIGLGILLAVIFSYLLSTKITHPVTKLKSASQLISQGDWKARVDIESRDELEELGESFNQMARDLEHLENLRRKMTADLAHELRNPLMSIQNYIEGMLDGVIEINREHLVDLHEEVERLTQLINDLQKLARVEGNRHLKIDSIYLREELTSYFKRIKLDFEGKDIDFDWSIAQVVVQVDKFILKEILQNILENALKYTPAGGQVNCAIDKIEDEKIIKIQIEDTGIGIDQNDLPYIFERFYRADPSRSRETGGTGIGLAVTKELVQLLDGDIRVESEKGVGTQFTITIPYLD